MVRRGAYSRAPSRTWTRAAARPGSSSSPATYGSLGAIVIFLVWLWISNLAILFGAEFNAELERGQRIAARYPPEQEPFVEPRDTRKMTGREH